MLTCYVPEEYQKGLVHHPKQLEGFRITLLTAGDFDKHSHRSLTLILKDDMYSTSIAALCITNSSHTVSGYGLKQLKPSTGQFSFEWHMN